MGEATQQQVAEPRVAKQRVPEPVPEPEPAPAAAQPSASPAAAPSAVPTATPRAPRLRRRHQVLLVAAAVVVAAAAVRLFGRTYVFFDMRIYHGAMEWWTGGGELYEFVSPGTTLGFTYPPFAALSMVPIAGLPMAVAGWVNTLLSVAALVGILVVVLVPVADRCGWHRGLTVAVALPLALAMEPNRETLGFGQVNLLLFALVIADLVALRWAAQQPLASRGRSAGGLRGFLRSGAWAGAGVGIAAAIKLTPALFIVYFLVSRQRRAAAVATVTAIGATLAAWALAPRESMTYFTSLLWDTDRVGAADFSPNQALSGLLARLYDQPEAPALLWLTFSAVCLVLGLSRAISAHQEGDELAAFTLVGLTAVVVSPISWTHHLVFVTSAVVVMGDAAIRSASSSGTPASRSAGLWIRRAAGRGLWPAGRGLGLVPALAGLRHGGAAVATYVLFTITPVWWVSGNRLPEGSHYNSGLGGVLLENSLILGLLLLLVLMPWRAGAEPAVPPPPAFPPSRGLVRSA